MGVPEDACAKFRQRSVRTGAIDWIRCVRKAHRIDDSMITNVIVETAVLFRVPEIASNRAEKRAPWRHFNKHITSH